MIKSLFALFSMSETINLFPQIRCHCLDYENKKVHAITLQIIIENPRHTSNHPPRNNVSVVTGVLL